MVLYPYYIYFFDLVGDSHAPEQDLDGNLTGADISLGQWKYYGKGRNSGGLNGSTKTLMDGTSYNVSGLICTSVNRNILREHTKVILLKTKIDEGLINDEFINESSNNGNMILNNYVKGFETSRLHTRIWV